MFVLVIINHQSVLSRRLDSHETVASNPDSNTDVKTEVDPKTGDVTNTVVTTTFEEEGDGGSGSDVVIDNSNESKTEKTNTPVDTTKPTEDK